MMVIRFAQILSLALFFFIGCGSPSGDVQSTGTSGSVATAASSPLLPNQLTPFPRVLVGGQPSAEQMKRIAEEGYRTVVNLRMPDERGNSIGKAEVEALGMEFHSLPVGGQGPTEEQVRVFSEILSREDSLPAVVHCAAGGRVGAIFALEAFWVEGDSVDAALEIGRKAGMAYMEPTVREIMAQKATS